MGLSILCMLITIGRVFFGEYSVDDSIMFSCGKSLYLSGKIENHYWYHFLTNYNLPCFSWFFQLPFFLLMTEKHHLLLIYIIPAFYLFVSLWILYALYSQIIYRQALVLFSTLLLTSVALNSLRFEVMSIPFLLILPAIVRVGTPIRFFISGIILGVIGNIHPAPMLIGVLLCIFYEFEMKESISVQVAMRYILSAGLCTFLFFLPLIFNNPWDWFYNMFVIEIIKDRHFFNIHVIKSVSGFIFPFIPFILTIIIFRRDIFSTKIRLRFFWFLVLMCFLMGRVLYCIYILPYIIYCVSNAKSTLKISRFYLVGLITIFASCLFIMPALSRIKNPEFFKQKRLLLEAISQFEPGRESTLWISAKYGLYTRKFEQTRSFSLFQTRFMRKTYQLKRGDVVFLTNNSDIKCFSKFFSVSRNNKVVRERILTPIPIMRIFSSGTFDILMLEKVVIQ